MVQWVGTYLWASLIESFWARARHREVFPVPGGPWRRMTLFHDTMLTVRQKLGAYSQASSSTARGEVLTINVRIAEQNCRIDVIQQLGFDTVGVNQALPEPFQAPARHLAHGGRDDFFLPIAASSAFIVGVVRKRLEDVNLQVRLGDWDGSVGARRFRGVDLFY